MIETKIEEVRRVLKNWNGPIAVAYSGGKDSSVVVKLVYAALLREPSLSSKVSFIYCDTEVESPVVDSFVKYTLGHLSQEMRDSNLQSEVKILKPRIDQSFFVRIIGRGYPPPTTFFRWCTTDLRIRPVQHFLKDAGPNSLVVVRMRWGGSRQRDRGMTKHGTQELGDAVIQKQRGAGSTAHLYMPIANFDFADVWLTLYELEVPMSIDVFKLAQLYREGSGECPVVREMNDKPCARARFGCWSCTVVRKDRSSDNLLQAGHSSLQPYADFRTWLIEFRQDPLKRCFRRRNGTAGLGPFTLAARREILDRLTELERQVDAVILSSEQRSYIAQLWEEDASSSKYQALEDPIGVSG
jgi:DNA sulfur modification protein DndC